MKYLIVITDDNPNKKYEWVEDNIQKDCHAKISIYNFQENPLFLKVFLKRLTDLKKEQLANFWLNMGIGKQKIEDIKGAINAFNKVDLINPENQMWNLLREVVKEDNNSKNEEKIKQWKEISYSLSNRFISLVILTEVKELTAIHKEEKINPSSSPRWMYEGESNTSNVASPGIDGFYIINDLGVCIYNLIGHTDNIQYSKILTILLDLQHKSQFQDGFLICNIGPLQFFSLRAENLFFILQIKEQKNSQDFQNLLIQMKEIFLNRFKSDINHSYNESTQFREILNKEYKKLLRNSILKINFAFRDTIYI